MLDVRKIALALTATLTAGGCTTTGGTPGATGVAVIPGGVSMQVGGPPGCTRSIGEFQAIVDSDVATGNVNKRVYDRIVGDLRGVKATCAAGRDADASGQLAAVKSRYGYR